LNRSKIRPDVLKIIDELLQYQMNGVFEFLKREENEGVDFQALWGKVMGLNEVHFKERTKTQDLYGLLTNREMHFLAKLLRFSFEYAVNIEQQRFPIPEDVEIKTVDVCGVPAEWQTIPGARRDRVLLYLHGGGFIMGSPNSHRLLTVALGEVAKMRVLSVDYRLAPEHPYPASLEDCAVAYNWLLSTGITPKNIVIAGDSAGGNLTLTTLIKLRDNGTPLPAGAVCLSPAADLAGVDDSFFENAETDPILADVGLFWWIPAYLAGADPSNPLISPICADLRGLPSLLIHASTSEMLYSASTRLAERAKAAGVSVILETWNAMPHVWHAFGLHDLTESKEAIARIGEFVKRLFD
jgi:monoterpene epsilon-lactone hydrolase